METKEYFAYRKELLNNSVYADGGGYADSLLLDNVLSECIHSESKDKILKKIQLYRENNKS